MSIHSVFLKALDLVDNPNLQQTKSEAPLASRLAACRSENFSAFVPIIVSRLFLETKTLELFLNAPTYKYATALRIYLHPPLVNGEEEDRKSFFEQDKFLAFSNPLRFLEIVRFNTSLLDRHLGTDEQGILVEQIDELVKTHIVPLHFLKSAQIFQDESDLSMNRVSPFVKYDVDDGVRDYCCWHQRSITPAADDERIPIPYFRLLKHKNEKVRTGAAVELYRALTDAGQDPAVLRDFHRPTLATALVQVGILDILFHLLSNRVEEEVSWSWYLQVAGAVVWKNREVNFEKHIEPHLDQIRFFLSVKNPNLLYHTAFFLSNLQQGRSDIIEHCLGTGLIEPVVELMKDGNNNVTQTNNEDEKDDDNDDNSSEPAIAPPQPYWYPAIRVLGNFSAESPELAKKLMEFRFFENVKPRLKVHKNNSCEVRKEILWTTSNLLIDFKREFIESDLLPLVLENARDTEHGEVQREALFALGNLFAFTPNSQDDDVQAEEETAESETISEKRAVFRYVLMNGAHSNFMESLEPFILSIFADRSDYDYQRQNEKNKNENDEKEAIVLLPPTSSTPSHHPIGVSHHHNLLKNKRLGVLNPDWLAADSEALDWVISSIHSVIKFERGVAQWYVTKRMLVDRKRAGDENYGINVTEIVNSQWNLWASSDDDAVNHSGTNCFPASSLNTLASNNNNNNNNNKNDSDNSPEAVVEMPGDIEVKAIETNAETLHNDSIHSESLRRCQETVKDINKKIKKDNNNDADEEEELVRAHAELESELKSMMEKVKAFSAKHDEFNSLIKKKMELKKLELEEFNKQQKEERLRLLKEERDNRDQANKEEDEEITDEEVKTIDSLLRKEAVDSQNRPMFLEASLKKAKKPKMDFYRQLKNSLLMKVWDDFLPLAGQVLMNRGYGTVQVTALKSNFDLTKRFVRKGEAQKYLKLYDEIQ